jgi:hypothetical protein
MNLQRVLLVVLVLVGGVSAVPTDRKWESDWVTTPAGVRFKTVIYYGPWKCRQEWLTECEAKCLGKKLESKGCIWIADIKLDGEGTTVLTPSRWGGRQAITHCCCTYPRVSNLNELRDKWKSARSSYREEWGREFGRWPVESSGDSWPGHHIHDLLHGGDPVGRNKVLPVRPDIHSEINTAYPQCYSGEGGWNTPGPYWPYTD